MNKHFKKRVLAHTMGFLVPVFFTLFLLVLGSGILPVSMLVLLLVALLLAMVFGVMSALLRGVLGVCVRFIMVPVVIVLAGMFFMMLVRGGLREAKAYGDRLSGAVIAYKDEFNTWPASMEEMPSLGQAEDIKEKWPFLYFRGDESQAYFKIGGFFISYSMDGGEPSLTIDRRGYGAKYNWTTRSWEETGRGHGSTS